MIKCGRCGAEGALEQREFRPWGLASFYGPGGKLQTEPEILYRGHCLKCGFQGYSCISPERATEVFEAGLDHNPIFDPWREAERACRVENEESII